MNPKDLRDIKLEDLSTEQLDRLIPELEALSEKGPLDYEPYKIKETGESKQLQFHCSDKATRLICGGNRSGKTTAGFLECLFHATGLYPKWYPEHLKIKGPNRGRMVGQDYAKWCGEVLEPKMREWLSPSLVVSIRKTHTGFVEKVTVRHTSGGNSTFDVMTHEQDDRAFEGWNGHWAWFDEPPPQEKFIATARGLVDYGGRSWLTLTPIREPWIYDEFILKQNPDVFFINIDTYDNPHLSKENIEKLLRLLTDDNKESRLHGKFKNLIGRIYKDFDPDLHCISETKVPIDSRWPVFFVLDPADRRPHHGIWARVNPFGTIYIVDELVFKGTIFEVSKEILKREITNKIDPLNVIRILDPNKGETPSAVSGLKLKDEFAKHAVYFLTNVNDDVALGHLAVAEKLGWDKTKPISTTNHPKLFFVKERTPECVKQLLTYVWDEWKGSNKDSRSSKEKPKDINKDMPDCIRYLVVFNPQFFVNESDPEVETSATTGYGH